jgi:hypothetical protein
MYSVVSICITLLVGSGQLSALVFEGKNLRHIKGLLRDRRRNVSLQRSCRYAHYSNLRGVYWEDDARRPDQNKNGNMAFLWRGYSLPNSFLYAHCFFAAQLIIWAVDTAQNSHANPVE